jgi:copper chaperone CopZ
LKEALNKVKVASVKADTASNKADQSTKDLVALGKRVKNLE